MNDNDIIKALECCKIKKPPYKCEECPLLRGTSNSCLYECKELAYDLIIRQKAEIADLKAKKKICAEVIARQDNEIDKLSKAVDNYESCLKCVEVITANAIKEFAEKLKSNIMRYGFSQKMTVNVHIDNLVKEMTEGKE